MNLQSLILEELLIPSGHIDLCAFRPMYSLAVLESQPRTGRRIDVAMHQQLQARDRKLRHLGCGGRT